MLLRSSREAEGAGAVGILAPFTPGPAAPVAAVGRVPGCTDCRPLGVSKMTRKWPVKGGASAAGLCSGSIWRDAGMRLSRICAEVYLPDNLLTPIALEKREHAL